MEPHKNNQLIQELRHFTGGECSYRHSLSRNYLYTEGVQYLAEQAGAYWLVDHIILHQGLASLKDEAFQVWNITVNNNSVLITVEDGNEAVLIDFHLDYTDFPISNYSLWLVNHTLLLPSEY